MSFLDHDQLRERFWKHQPEVSAGFVSRRWPGEPGWNVELVFANIDGRTECVGLAVIGDVARGTGPLTTSLLRRLPLARLVQEERRAAITWAENLSDMPELIADLEKEIASRFNAPKKAREWKYDDAHYQLVADAYDQAIREGINPTAHVAAELRLTRTQAKKHVWRARRRKKPDGTTFLPPTEQRVPKGNE